MQNDNLEILPKNFKYESEFNKAWESGDLQLSSDEESSQQASQPQHDSNNYQIQQQEINDESIAANNVQASSPLIYPPGNGSLTEPVTNSITQENYVVFEAPIYTKLPTQTDPRRYISLHDEARNEININITGCSIDSGQIQIDLALVTSYKGQWCFSLFGFEVRHPKREIIDIYRQELLIREVSPREYRISLGTLHVRKKNNNELYEELQKKSKKLKKNSVRKYQLIRYPSGEKLVIGAEEGLTTFIKKNQLHQVKLAVRFFIGSSTTPFPIVGPHVENNYLLSNTLSMDDKSSITQEPIVLSDQTDHLATETNGSSTTNTDFDNRVILNHDVRNDRIDSVWKSVTDQHADYNHDDFELKVPLRHESFGIEEEQRLEMVQNSSVNTRGAVNNKRACDIDAVNCGSTNSKKKNSMHENEIRIVVKHLLREDEISIIMKPTDQIRELKFQISLKWHINIEKQRLLIHPAETLLDECTIQHYRIEDGTRIFLDPLFDG